MADERRIRIAYERGRLVRAALAALPVGGLVLIAFLFSRTPAWTTGCGALLVVATVVLLWRGRAWGRAVLPGVVAGSVPLALALIAMNVGHVCSHGHCMSLCLPACFGGAVIAGLWLAQRMRRTGRRALLASATVALATGAMGCGCIGTGGLVGLGLGLILMITPALLRPAPAS